MSAATCVWNNGSVAEHYAPCDPNALHSTCCRSGEACLSQGLCFGDVGMVYRGACTATPFYSYGCPDYFVDSFPLWANIFGCYVGETMPFLASWWCGTGTACSDNDGNRSLGTFIYGLGNFTIERLIPDLTTAQNSSSTSSVSLTPATSVSTPQSTPQSTLPSTPLDLSTCHTAVVAGGIAGPLTVLIIVLTTLWLWTRRKLKQSQNIVAQQSYVTLEHSRQGYQAQRWTKQPGELDNTTVAYELPSEILAHELHSTDNIGKK